MDQELIAYLDARFRETNQQIADLREETTRRFEQVGKRFDEVEESIRHTRIEVEGLRGEIRQVAEGVVGVAEQLESFKKDTNRRIHVLERFGRPSPQT